MSEKLTEAARAGKKRRVRKLIAKGADVDHVNEHDFTALILAAANNYVDIVDLLISSEANLEAKDRHGKTALLFACLEGYQETIEVLLKASASVTARNDSGETVLHLAVKNDNQNILNMLVDKGAEIDALDNFGRTPLMEAATSLKLNNVKCLLKMGAEVNLSDNEGDTVVILAVDCFGEHYWREVGVYFKDRMDSNIPVIRALDLIVEKEKNIDPSIKQQIEQGIADKIIAIIAALKKSGSDLGIKGKGSRTALARAEQLKYHQIAEFLRNA